MEEAKAKSKAAEHGKPGEPVHRVYDHRPATEILKDADSTKKWLASAGWLF